MKPRTYPHYSTWRDAGYDCYEVVRWDDHMTPVVVQTGLLTYNKAHQALREWRERAWVAEQMARLHGLEARLAATTLTREDNDDAA